MLLPSCGNENRNDLLKIGLCKNKRERDENREPVFLFCNNFLHISRCALAFDAVFCFKSTHKNQTKLAVRVPKIPCRLSWLWINLLTFFCNKHTARFALEWRSQGAEVTGKLMRSRNRDSMLWAGGSLPSSPRARTEVGYSLLPAAARAKQWVPNGCCCEMVVSA